MKSGFLDKLIARMDRLDPKSVQTHFLRLMQEHGLLETIFQSIQEGVIVIDGAGRFSYANRAAEQMLGFSFDSVKGRPASRYLRDIDWDRILKLDEGEWSRLITHEIEITYPEHRFVTFYVVPMSSTENAEGGALIILRDVTRDRKHEADMLESERINAVKLLAAGVAHEIGNPLNALNIHLQLLSREIRALPDKEKENLGELVRVAENEVSRLDLIITQFLRALRPTKPSFVLLKIDDVLKETLNLLQHEVQDRAITIELDCSKAVPKMRVDRDQIKQAFFNLIRNAFQAMPDGGALRISRVVANEFLAISFEDTGVGIQSEDLGHIFEPHYSTKPSGSGLGLLIVQRIVQDHGGQIEIISKPGEGTTFTLMLPLARRRIRLLKAHARQRAEKL